MPKSTNTPKQITLNILNGLSIGIIVALVPGALLNNLTTALLPILPQLSFITLLTGIAQSMLPILSAVCVGMLAKFSPIHTASLALAAMAGAGNVHAAAGGLQMAGTGDVINIALTIAIGYLLIQLLGNALKAYTILLMPSIVLVVAGGIGLLTLQPVGAITAAIGEVINQLTTLQPILMGMLMGAGFALIVVSPISSVGIGTAVGLTGIASGSANLGVVAAGFSLAVYGFQVNGFGTSIAHFLGSPKLQMANLLSRPKLFVPMTVNAAILGGLGAAFSISGTAMSAGFGFAGLIGPLAAIAEMKNPNMASWILVGLLFFVVPLGLALTSNFLFTKCLHYQDASDYALAYD